MDYEEADRKEILGNMIVIGVSFVVIAAIVVAVMVNAGTPHKQDSNQVRETPRNQNHTSIQLGNHAGIQPGNHTGFQPGNHRGIEPENHRGIEPENPTGIQLGNHTLIHPRNHTRIHPMNHTRIHLSFDTSCGEMDHRGLCRASLASVEGDADAVAEAIKATLVAIKNVSKGGIQKGELGDCIGLIELGIGKLEPLLTVGSEDFLGRKSGDVRQSLRDVIWSQQICLEQLASANSRSAVNQALQKPIGLAKYALRLIYESSKKDVMGAEMLYKHHIIF